MTKAKATKKTAKKVISARMRREFRRLTLMDNMFMNLALDGNIPCVQDMLQVILKKPDLVVLKAKTQWMFQGFRRSLYLDIYAEDSEGNRYNIEIQQASEGADPRRPRFHGAMMDAHALEAGQDFKELPDCYVIFITQEDVLKRGKMIYTIHRYVDDDFQPFEDGSHIIYINASAEADDSDLWKLIHDLKCEDASEMFFPRLAARVKSLKDEEEGIVTMSNYFEELQEKAINRAVKRAVDQAVKETEERVTKAATKAATKQSQESIALKLIQLGELTLEKIAACSGLTLQRVRALARAM